MFRNYYLGLALVVFVGGALLWTVVATGETPSLAEAQTLTPLSWTESTRRACVEAPSRTCLLHWALFETRRIRPTSSDLLASIAVSWGRPQLLTEAGAAARQRLSEMSDDERQATAHQILGNLSEHEAELGLVERAKDTLSKIGDARGRGLAAARLAGKLAAVGEPKLAQEVVERIADPRHQAAALGRIVVAQIQAGDFGRAQDNLQWLGSIARQASDAGSWAQFLVTRALVDRGKVEAALDIALRIDFAYYRALALAGIGARTGRADLFEAAEAAARATPSLRQIQGTLIEVATLAAESGHWPMARLLLSEIPVGHDRARASAQVARGLAKSGRFDRAIELVERIEDDFQRAGAVAGIVQIDARPDLVLRLKGLLTDLDPIAKDEAWRAIAGALARQGHKTAAVGAASRIENYARVIETLASVAVLAGDSAVLLPAAALQKYVRNPRERSRCLAALAVAQAELGMVGDAARTLAQIPDPEARIGALILAANRFAPRRRTLEPGRPIEDVPTSLPGPGVFYALLP